MSTPTSSSTAASGAATSGSSVASPTPVASSAAKPKGLSALAAFAQQLQQTKADDDGDGDGSDDDNTSMDNSSFATSDFNSSSSFDSSRRRPAAAPSRSRPRTTKTVTSSATRQPTTPTTPSPTATTPTSGSSTSWFGRIKNVLPVALVGSTPPPAAASPPAEYSDEEDSSSSRRNRHGHSSTNMVAAREEQQAFIFSDKINLTEHIAGVGDDRALEDDDDEQSRPKKKTNSKKGPIAPSAASRRATERASSGSDSSTLSSRPSGGGARSRSSSAVRSASRSRMPPLAEEPEDRSSEGDDAHSPEKTKRQNTKSTSVSTAGSGSSSTAASRAASKSPLTAGSPNTLAAAGDDESDDDVEGDDPVARAQRRARESSRGRSAPKAASASSASAAGKEKDRQRRLGSDDTVDDGGARLSQDRGDSERWRKQGSAPKPAPRVRNTSAPSSRETSLNSRDDSDRHRREYDDDDEVDDDDNNLESHRVIPPKPRSSPTGSAPSRDDEDMADFNQHPSPSPSPSPSSHQRSDSPHSRSQNQDEHAVAVNVSTEAANERLSESGTLESPKAVDSSSRDSADPLGLGKPKSSSLSPASHSHTASTGSVSSVSSSVTPSAAANAAPKKRRKKVKRGQQKTPRMIPLSQWVNMPVELVVRDALLTRRIVDALVHLKERMVKLKRAALESEKASAHAIANYAYHLINPVPLFRRIANQLLYQSLSLDHTGSDVLAGGWILKSYHEKSYVYLKRILYETTKKMLREKLIKHFAHLSEEQLTKLMAQSSLFKSGQSASNAVASSAATEVASTSTDASSNSSSSSGNLFSDEALFEESLESLLWEEEESRRKAKFEREFARLTAARQAGKVAREALDKERQRERESEQVSRSVRESYMQAVYQRTHAIDAGEGFFTPLALATDSLLYEMLCTLEYAYPNPSYVTSFNRTASAVVLRHENEESYDTKLRRAVLEDIRQVYLRGRKPRISKYKHSPDEFVCVRTTAGADTSSNRKRPHVKTGASPVAAYEYNSPTGSSSASKESPGGAHRARSGTVSMLPLGRSTSSPQQGDASTATGSTAAGLGMSALVRNRSGGGSNNAEEEENASLNLNLSSSIASAAVSSLTIHPFLGSIDSDRVGSSTHSSGAPLSKGPLQNSSGAQERHPDFLSSSDSSDSSESDDSEADDHKKPTVARGSVSGRPGLAQGGRPGATQGRPGAVAGRQVGAGSGGGGGRGSIIPGRGRGAAGAASAAAADSSSSDSSSDSSSSESEDENSVTNLLSLTGDVTDLTNPIFSTVTIPLSTEDQGGSGTPGEHTPPDMESYLLQGRTGQIRGLTRVHAAFAPLTSEYHPLDPSYRGEKHGGGPLGEGGDEEEEASEYEDENSEEDAEEDKEALERVAALEREMALEKEKSKAENSCIACRMDNDIQRSTCLHEGYLHLDLLSLSKWSLQQFYLTLLDKQGDFISPASATVNGGTATSAAAPQAFSQTPIDFKILVQQMAEWIVDRERKVEVMSGKPSAHGLSSFSRADRIQMEIFKQRLIFTECRFLYLLTHNDWRRMVSFIESLPLTLNSSRAVVTPSGHLAIQATSQSAHVSSEMENVEQQYQMQLLHDLPQWIHKYQQFATYFMSDLIATELGRHGLFYVPARNAASSASPNQMVIALPKTKIELPLHEGAIDASSYVYIASQMEFLPLARKLARLGLLFRQATAQDRVSLMKMHPTRSSQRESMKWNNQSSKHPLMLQLKHARSATEQILAGLNVEDAYSSLSDADANAQSNSALASLHHLLPFHTLSPFHVWMLHFLHQLGSNSPAGTAGVQILSTYLSHYKLTNFDVLVGISKGNKAESLFRGWSGIELYLRQGELYKAGLMNCNTYLVHLGGVVGGGAAPKPAATPSPPVVSSPPAATGAKKEKDSLFGSSSSAFGTSSATSKAKDPTQTVFMQNLFDRGLHRMALATLMYYPHASNTSVLDPSIASPTGASGTASSSAHSVANKKSSRLLSANPLLTLKRNLLRAAAAEQAMRNRNDSVEHDMDQIDTSSNSRAVKQAKKKAQLQLEEQRAAADAAAAVAAASAKNNKNSKNAKEIAANAKNMPGYIIPGSSLFFRSSAGAKGDKANTTKGQRKRIDFKSTESLPLQWFDASNKPVPQLFLLTSSVSILPSISQQPLTPRVVPLQILGNYLVQFKELSLALYEIPKRIRSQLIQREELTTGNLYAWRKESIFADESSNSSLNQPENPESLDASASFEGFGALQVRRDFKGDISLFDMIADLLRRPSNRARLIELDGKKKTNSTSSSSSSKKSSSKLKGSAADQNEDAAQVLSWLDRVDSTLDASILSLFDNPAYAIELIPLHLQPGYVPPQKGDEADVNADENATKIEQAPPAKRDQLLMELTGEGDDDLLGSEADEEALLGLTSKKEEAKQDVDKKTLQSLPEEPAVTADAPAGPPQPPRALLEVFPSFPLRLPHFSHPSVRVYGDVHELTYDYFLRKAQPLRAFHVYLASRGLSLNESGQLIVSATKQRAPSEQTTKEKEALFQAVLSLALKHLLDVRVKISCVVFLHLCGIRAHLLRMMVVAAYRIYRVWMQFNQKGDQVFEPTHAAITGQQQHSHPMNPAMFRSRSGSVSSVASMGSIGSVRSMGSQHELRVPAFHEDIDVAHAANMARASDDDASDDDLELRVHEEDMSARVRSPGIRSRAMSRSLSPVPHSQPQPPANANQPVANQNANQPLVDASELQAAVLSHINHLLLPLVPILARNILVVPTAYHTAFKSLYDATMFLAGGLAGEDASDISPAVSSTDEHELNSGAGDPSLTTFDRFFETDSSIWVLVLRFQQAFHQPLTTFPHHLLTLHIHQLVERQRGSSRKQQREPQAIELSKAFSVETIFQQAHQLQITVDELLRLLNQLAGSVGPFDRDYSRDASLEIMNNRSLGSNQEHKPWRHFTMELAQELPLIISDDSKKEAPEVNKDWYSTFLHCLPAGLFSNPYGMAPVSNSDSQPFTATSKLDSKSYGSIMRATVFARLLMGQQQLAAQESFARIPPAVHQSASNAAMTTLNFLGHVNAVYPHVTDLTHVPTPVLKNLLSIIHHLQHLSDLDVILAASRSSTAWPSWSLTSSTASRNKKNHKAAQGAASNRDSSAAALIAQDATQQTGERLLQLCRLSGHPLLALLSYASPLLQRVTSGSSMHTPSKPTKSGSASAASASGMDEHLLNCVNVYLYLITTQAMDRMKLIEEKNMAARKLRRQVRRKRQARRAHHATGDAAEHSISTTRSAPHSGTSTAHLSSRLSQLSSLPSAATDASHAVQEPTTSFHAEDLLDEEVTKTAAGSKGNVDLDDTLEGEDEDELSSDDSSSDENETAEDLDEAETYETATTQQKSTGPTKPPSSIASSPLLLRYFHSGSLNVAEFKYLLLDYLIHPILPHPHPHASLRPLLAQTLRLFTPQSPLLSLIEFACDVERMAFANAEKKLERFVVQLTEAAQSERKEKETTLAQTLLCAVDLFEVATLFMQHLLGGRYHAEMEEEEWKEMMRQQEAAYREAGFERTTKKKSSAAEHTASFDEKSAAIAALPYRPSSLPTPPSLLTSPFTPPLRLPKLDSVAFKQAFLLRILKQSGFFSLFQHVVAKEFLAELKSRSSKPASSTTSPAKVFNPFSANENLNTSYPALTKLYPSFLALCRERLNSLLSIFDHSLTHSTITNRAAAAAAATAATSANDASNVTHRIRDSVPFHLRDIHAGLRTTERIVQHMGQTLEKLYPAQQPMMQAIEPVLEEEKPEAKEAAPVAPPVAVKAPESVAPAAAPAAPVVSYPQPQRSRFSCIPYRLYQPTAATERAKSVIPLGTLPQPVPNKSEQATAAAVRAGEQARQNLLALDAVNSTAPTLAAAAKPAATPSAVPSAAASSILQSLEASLQDFQASFLWCFTAERVAFWTEAHGQFVAASAPRDEKHFFAQQLAALKAQLSLQEKEMLLRYIEQASLQQQEQERLASMTMQRTESGGSISINPEGSAVSGESSSASASTVTSTGPMNDETFKNLMASVLKQAIVPAKVKAPLPPSSAASVSVASPTTPTASPSKEEAATSSPTSSPSTDATLPNFPTTAALPTSPTAASSTAIVPVANNSNNAPLCFVHNANCLFHNYVSPAAPFLLNLPMTSLPDFLLFVPPTLKNETTDSFQDELASLSGSQTLVSQVWPPPPPALGAKEKSNETQASMVWCGCAIERTAASDNTGEAAWLPLASSDVRYGVYMTSLYKVGLGDFAVGRTFAHSTGAALGAPLDLSQSRTLVSAFEALSGGYKSRDLQLLEIASIVLTHVLGNVRDPAPYPKLPRLGCVVLVKHNPTLQASEPSSGTVTPSKKAAADANPKATALAAAKLPANLSLSPHVHRSLILDSLTAVSWFGRNISAKLHLLSDLGELLQTTFEEVYFMQLPTSASSTPNGKSASSSSSAANSSPISGISKLLARILQACMLHRQRDRKKFHKKLETLKQEFFENAASAHVDAVTASSPSARDHEDPTFLWSAIERLERLKESHREIGRLHPYSEMFLRIIQCYELKADLVADVISDTLQPYICQALKELQPQANFVVTTHPVKEEIEKPAPVVVVVVEKPVQHAPLPPVSSDNILGSGYDSSATSSAHVDGGNNAGSSMTSAASITNLAAAAATSSSANHGGPLTADPDADVDEPAEALERDVEGNLQPIRKKTRTVVVNKTVAAQLRATKQRKVRERAEEQKRLAYVAHLAHLDALASRRAALQAEALDRKRNNETLDEEEKWWTLFMKNLLAGLAFVQPSSANSSQGSNNGSETRSANAASNSSSSAASQNTQASGLSELSMSFLHMAHSFAASSVAAAMPLEMEVLDRAAGNNSASRFKILAPQTHSYTNAQAEAVALCLAYKFALAGLNSTGVSNVIRSIAQRLPLMLRLAEEGVLQPLEILLRGVLVWEYHALKLVFEHAGGFTISSASSSSASSVESDHAAAAARAGLALLSELQRSLVPACSVLFRQHLSRFLQEAWTEEGMVSHASRSSEADALQVRSGVGVHEERYLTLCRFFGLFRPLSLHYIRQAVSALGQSMIERIMNCWSEIRGENLDPAQWYKMRREQEKEGAVKSEEEDDVQADGNVDSNGVQFKSPSNATKLSPSILTALTTSFDLISPRPSVVISIGAAGYAQNALLSASQYLQYVDCQQGMIEVEVMLAFTEYCLTESA